MGTNSTSGFGITATSDAPTVASTNSTSGTTNTSDAPTEVSINSIDQREVGSCVTCIPGGTNMIYHRYVGNNIIRPYPNKDIEKSWDPSCSVEFVICGDGGYTIGTEMEKQPTFGASVRCRDNETSIHSYVGDSRIRLYPSPGIAYSWNPNWDVNMVYIDCSSDSGVAIGRPLNQKP